VLQRHWVLQSNFAEQDLHIESQNRIKFYSILRPKDNVDKMIHVKDRVTIGLGPVGCNTLVYVIHFYAIALNDM